MAKKQTPAKKAARPLAAPSSPTLPQPTASAVPPAPVAQEPEMAATPLTTGLDGSPVVNPPESEVSLLSPPTQASLSADQSDPTDQPDLTDPTDPTDPTDQPDLTSPTAPSVAFLTQSEHTSSLEDGQGLIQAPPLEETPPVAVVTLPATYSTRAGVPTKPAGKYYTPKPPSLR